MPPSHREEYAGRVVVKGIPKALTYLLPKGVQEQTSIGSEVTVEVSSRKTKGWMIDRLTLEDALEEFQRDLDLKSKQEIIENKAPSQLGFFSVQETAFQPKHSLKPILAAHQAFRPEQLQLFEWMADYYGSNLPEIIDTVIPRKHTGKPVLVARLSEETAQALHLESDWLDKLQRRAPLQLRILKFLSENGGSLPLSHLAHLGASVRSSLNSLASKDYLTIEEALFEKSPSYLSDTDVPMFSSLRPEELTDSQKNALKTILQAIEARAFSPLLLYGVTGSGKTEVYIRAIEDVIENNGSALVIVPEIALTPQLVDQFRARLNCPVAVLHSQVGQSSRWKAWEAILRGQISVAIGARSAVFAPLNNLRLIVVDEEHESSYKQSDGLRYNARDVAVMRAKYAECSIVLGSATPSFESLYNVQKKRYQLIEIPERVTTRPLPKLEIVDMRSVKRRDMPSENVSPQLAEAIGETLDNNGQVIILYNRRGFSSYLQCSTCSEVVSCPNCSVALTFHQRRQKLLCHYCNLSLDPPTHCRFCRNPRTSRIEVDENGKPLERNSVIESTGELIHRGGGTEKVVSEISELFPKARIIRMDRDTVGRKEAYREILGSMRSGESNVLVGTQMIAKGHDLPGVTLVGIVDADVGLHLPDFRSGEKAFQLVTQAAGRAGRGKEPGRVLVQTREPNHPTIVATATGRFKAFARYELQYRQSLDYPPFGKLMRLVVSSRDREEAFQAAQFVGRTVRVLAQRKGGVTPEDTDPKPALAVLGPAPAPHEKLCGRYRWHILIKARSAKMISELAHEINEWKATVRQFSDLRLVVDVDPVDML